MTSRDAKPESELAHLRRVNASLAAYREMSERLFAAMSLEQVGRIAVSMMCEVFGAQGGALLLAADSGPGAIGLGEYGATGEAWHAVPVEQRRGLLELVLRETDPVIAADAAAFLSRAGLGPAAGVLNFMALPLRGDDRALGALIAYNFVTPEYLGRYAAEATSFAAPVQHAILHVGLLEARDRQARLLETIIENTETQFAYLDRDMNFVLVNSAYVRGCGHAREELIGRNHFHFFPNAENQAIFERVRDQGAGVAYREKPFEYADQPERGVTYWDWTLTPVKDERGEVEGLVLSLTDMTEKVRQRARMLEAERARAELAETLTAEVSHRMKNNLTIVAGLLQLQIAEEPPGSRAAAIIADAVARLRAFAVIHEQMRATEAEAVALLDAIHRIADAARQTFGANVEVAVTGAQVSYPGRAAANLCIIANELITNAVKYGAPEGDGRLRIRVHVGGAEGQLRLSVWNSGNPVLPGFDPRQKKTMGLRLVYDMTARQYQGSFTLRPHEGGTLAEVVISDEALRGEA